MKVQDIGFLLILTVLIWLRRPLYLAVLGIIFLFLAVILFKFSVLFTAERLTWYAAALFLITIIFNITKIKK